MQCLNTTQVSKIPSFNKSLDIYIIREYNTISSAVIASGVSYNTLIAVI